MKLSKMLLSFGTVALAIASAASSYRFSIFEPSYFGGQELKPGDYRVQLNGDKATIKSGKQMIESQVKVENAPQKFDQTAVEYNNTNGKMIVQEIHVGGTTTRLVFSN